jgi:glyoxylase-like metal-dependent hydrolase (beta-lactamase superfamily II)
LPTGNDNEMKKSLKKFFKAFKDDDWILPGHGKIARLKDVKVNNPYYQE